MAGFQISIMFILFSSALAWGGNYGQGEGYDVQNSMPKSQRSQGQNFDISMGRMGRQFGEDSKKYRSNLYSDDDVYGYDATYPNGEVSYINYKSKEARGKRGPEFRKISRAYSHGKNEGQNAYESGYKRANGFMVDRAHSQGSHLQNRDWQY